MTLYTVNFVRLEVDEVQETSIIRDQYDFSSPASSILELEYTIPRGPQKVKGGRPKKYERLKITCFWTIWDHLLPSH